MSPLFMLKLILMKCYSLTSVKLIALYKQLMTETTLAYIFSTDSTLNIVVYYYHLANKISLSLSLSLCCVYVYIYI